MIKQFSNPRFITLAVILLGIIAILFVLTRREEKTFDSEILKVDTAQLTKMVITPKNDASKELIFTRISGSAWKLESAGISYVADQNAIRNILTEMNNVRADRVAANDKRSWPEYQLTDNEATRLRMYGKDGLLRDLLIGKLSYNVKDNEDMLNPQNQNKGTMLSYVRLAGETEIYAVAGFLKINIQPSLSAYRDKKLFEAHHDSITSVAFLYPADRSFTIEKKNGVWLLDGSKADSSSVSRYLKVISRISTSDFIDGAKTVTPTPTHRIKIEGKGFEAVELGAYPAVDSSYMVILTSSRLQGAKINGRHGGLFQRVFISKDKLQGK